MGSVRTSIIGRPRRLPGQRHAVRSLTTRYTLICEEPHCSTRGRPATGAAHCGVGSRRLAGMAGGLLTGEAPRHATSVWWGLRGFHLRCVRRRPTLPQPPGCSTIGAVGLSFRVRDGTGRFPYAMTAVTLSPSPAAHSKNEWLSWGGGQWVTYAYAW